MLVTTLLTYSPCFAPTDTDRITAEWRLYFQRTGLLVMYLDALKGAIINERDLAMETLRFAANCVIEVGNDLLTFLSSTLALVIVADFSS